MNHTNTEIWKDVPSFEGLYQVSNLGNIKSLDRIMWVEKRKRFLSLKGRILKPKLDKYGYLQVTLCKNHIYTYTSVHRIIAKTFIENLRKYKQVNHINLIKTDNKVENLEWCSDKMNKFHNWKIKSIKKNYPLNINYEDYDMYLSEFRSGKLKLEQVIEIRKLYSEGFHTQEKLAKMFNVSDGCIYSIVNFKKWKPE